jgi:hypothetical protein
MKVSSTFDNATQLLNVASGQGHANAMAHIPSRLVRTKTHESANLQDAHALLARQHEMRYPKPILQWLIRILKDGASDVGKSIGRHWRTGIALPMPGVALQGREFRRLTARAFDAIGPSLAHKVCAAGFFIGKCLIKLRRAHLVDQFLGRHVLPPMSMIGVCHG